MSEMSQTSTFQRACALADVPAEGAIGVEVAGIPEDEARRLVIRGFFGELIAKIAVPELRDRITAAIEAELAAGAGEVRR